MNKVWRETRNTQIINLPLYEYEYSNAQIHLIYAYIHNIYIHYHKLLSYAHIFCGCFCLYSPDNKNQLTILNNKKWSKTRHWPPQPPKSMSHAMHQEGEKRMKDHGKKRDCPLCLHYLLSSMKQGTHWRSMESFCSIPSLLSRVEVTTLFLMGEDRVHLDFYASSSLFIF